ALAGQVNDIGRMDAIIHNAGVYLEPSRSTTAEGHAKTPRRQHPRPLPADRADRPPGPAHLPQQRHAPGSCGDGGATPLLAGASVGSQGRGGRVIMSGWAVMGTGDRGRGVAGVRRRIGAAIFERVAGPEGPSRRQVISAGGERWFAARRPVRRVQGASSMFIGGIRALLLQSLHPLAMAAVAGHSGYRGDPWGRLQRTSYFLAVTTFGRDGDGQEAIARVRAIHRRVTGTAPDGRPYAASDPHLLTWVHIAEADSFLRAHTRFGAEPLDQAGRDGYVADLARIGAALGVPDPP